MRYIEKGINSEIKMSQYEEEEIKLEWKNYSGAMSKFSLKNKKVTEK